MTVKAKLAYASADNLAPNGSLEVNAVGWSGYLCTTERSDEAAKYGSHSLKVVSSASDYYAVSYGQYSAVDIPATAGESYYAGLWIKALTAGRTARLDTHFLTAGGASAGYLGGTNTPLTVNEWTFVPGPEQVAPATTATITWAIYPDILLAGDADEIFYLDGFVGSEGVAVGTAVTTVPRWVKTGGGLVAA
jgi:hypothetical protein